MDMNYLKEIANNSFDIIILIIYYQLILFKIFVPNTL